MTAGIQTLVLMMVEQTLLIAEPASTAPIFSFVVGLFLCFLEQRSHGREPDLEFLILLPLGAVFIGVHTVPGSQSIIF